MSTQWVREMFVSFHCRQLLMKDGAVCTNGEKTRQLSAKPDFFQ